MAHRDRYPELDNFLGFGEFENGNNEDVNINGAENSLTQSPFGYKPHLELSEILLGVKEGRYF